jgi:regulator of PEP synthase PpsR (kinase-PPPase family)
VPASLAETLRKPRASLTDEYFQFIEAVEYTRKMDDGAHPTEWKNADLLILVRPRALEP